MHRADAELDPSSSKRVALAVRRSHRGRIRGARPLLMQMTS